MKSVCLMFFVFSALLFSCSKETVKTPGQVSADQINSVVNQSSIKYAVVHDWTGSYYSSTTPLQFSVSGQYIVTHDYSSSGPGSTYYNLERLSHFNIGKEIVGNQDTVTALEIYFK